MIRAARACGLLAGALLSTSLLAAPDEAALGKAQGYPACAIGAVGDTKCLVGALSHFDKLYPAKAVAKGPAVRELKRAPNEPPITYRMGMGNPSGPVKTVDDFLAENRNTGLLVLKDDLILVERYQYDRKPEQRFQSYSMAKTVLSMLVGIALSEQKIRSIDDRADAYVPDLKGHPYGETTLRHLLTMSSGVRFAENYSGDDDSQVLGAKTIGQRGPGGVDAVSTFRTREAPAGTRFKYASGESQVLALVLRAAVKQPLVEYLSEKIWKPMGAEADATWHVDAGGQETGFMGINATLRDWGRFGLLLAHDGARDGKQIIPAEWVKAATTAEAPHLQVGVASKFNGYGYQTWLIHPKDRIFAALGLRGQAVMVDPARKVVMVHTGVYGVDGSDRGPQFALFYGTLRSLALHMNNP